MITKEQVAGLRPGDVVEYGGHPDLHGAALRGPLHVGSSGHLLIGDYVVRRSNGQAPDYRVKDLTLTVIARAPRPLYANHDRAEPAPGDVVRVQGDREDDAYTDVYLPRHEHDHMPWLSLHPDEIGTRYPTDEAIPTHLDGWSVTLLVDGATGQVVP